MSLKTQLSASQARLTEIIDEIEGVGVAAEADSRELNESDQSILVKLQDESTGLEKSIGILQSSLAATEKAKAARVPTPATAADIGHAAGIQSSLPKAGLPGRARYARSKVFDSVADAYGCGRWVQAMIGKDAASMQWCRDQGWVRNDMEGDTDAAGGFAVPDPLAATMVRLVEEFGVFRRFARPAIMTSNTLDVPKIAGHTQVYYPGQGEALTTSDLVLGQINLVAKKYASMTLLSTELQEDAVVSMVDQIVTDFAWAFARAEDLNSFLGDGTPTYGGITGIESALSAASTVDAAGGISLSILEQMIAKLPQYAGMRPRWFMHSYTYFGIVVPALIALGGTDIRQAEEGGENMLYGYPVTFTQVLPGSGQAIGQMPVVLGDLGLGAYSGTRRNFNFRQLNELFAATDQIGVSATMRADSVIHDIGSGVDAGAIVMAKLS